MKKGAEDETAFHMWYGNDDRVNTGNRTGIGATPGFFEVD